MQARAPSIPGAGITALTCTIGAAVGAGGGAAGLGAASAPEKNMGQGRRHWGLGSLGNTAAALRPRAEICGQETPISPGASTTLRCGGGEAIFASVSGSECRQGDLRLRGTAAFQLTTPSKSVYGRSACSKRDSSQLMSLLELALLSKHASLTCKGWSSGFMSGLGQGAAPGREGCKLGAGGPRMKGVRAVGSSG